MCPIIPKKARRVEINLMDKCMTHGQTSYESAAKTINLQSFLFTAHIRDRSPSNADTAKHLPKYNENQGMPWKYMQSQDELN